MVLIGEKTKGDFVAQDFKQEGVLSVGFFWLPSKPWPSL